MCMMSSSGIHHSRLQKPSLMLTWSTIFSSSMIHLPVLILSVNFTGGICKWHQVGNRPLQGSMSRREVASSFGLRIQAVSRRTLPSTSRQIPSHPGHGCRVPERTGVCGAPKHDEAGFVLSCHFSRVVREAYPSLLVVVAAS